MSFSCSNYLRCSAASHPGSLHPRTRSVAPTESLGVPPFDEESKERVRQMFNKVQLSVSSYDTAWVAMVPSPHSSGLPHFPRSLNWLMDKQLLDGSWGLPHPHPLLLKDSLLATLASVLALKKWGSGERQIIKGLEFLASNSTYLADEKQHTPIGFYTLFSSMIEKAGHLDLALPFRSADTDFVQRKRTLELNQEGRSSFLGYVSEAMGSLSHWEAIMKHQRRNGSLFNSPSATAAALIQLKDPRCLSYLESLMTKFDYAVPTVYPLEIYARLCLVENLETLGVHRHFGEEINSVLDDTYRFWQQHEEEIFTDSSTCAMAFRLLRSHGYDVSSDELTHLADEADFRNSLGGYVGDVGGVLELYKASQMLIDKGEKTLESIHSWTSHFLRNRLLDGEIYVTRLQKNIHQEVEYALKVPLNANLEKLENRRNIEHFNGEAIRIFKSAVSCPNFGDKDLLDFALRDFNYCQSMYQMELKHLERWVAENKLDELQFARQKLAYCYFSAAATLSMPELSDARQAWAKNSVLTTIVDDFYDVGGSKEEHENLLQLMKMSHLDISNDCCSEQVKIIFSALQAFISEIGEKAFGRQGRDVTSHVKFIWIDLIESMSKEAEWTRNQTVPTIAEYMANGYVSFALGPIVLPALYLVGPKISEEAVASAEYRSLFELMSTNGRLLNDVRGFERECSQGKLNIVSLHMIHGNGSSYEEVARERVNPTIASNTRELLRLVLGGEDSQVPRACRDLFWKMSSVLNFFYLKDDGFTSQEIASSVKALLGQPITRTSDC
ncbi:hypothetical protein MLD38_016365 [Melastoma candidum]|uniref:Uncharacterized protein n=1 Tax=Melastoma candidum TaxID=119954 RepID=A0ACB9RMA1_9MYRT|nr:hypothetical protein MLD38_016365 [Melastoma candidum]